MPPCSGNTEYERRFVSFQEWLNAKYMNFWHSRGFVCLSCNLVQQACFPSLVFCFPHAAFRTEENLSDCKLKDDEEKHS